MPEIISKDILTIDHGIVCHQVNCRGKMGAGIAKKIRHTWPLAYRKYMYAFNMGWLKLGYVQLVKITDELYVGNLAGQYNYGRDRQYTNYDAVRKCLRQVARFSSEQKLPVYIPYKMGCSLAGGDWNEVFKIISEELPDSTICCPDQLEGI